MDHQTYHKILSGNASEKEKEAFYDELNRDAETKKEFIELKQLWDLNVINQTKVSSQRKNQLFHEFWSVVHLNKQKTVQQIFFGWGKYAAIVILALLAGFYLNSFLNQASSESWKQFHSENGNISSILLEDGSKIWLNSNTTLSLNEQKGEVTVKLEGEAYFEIKHNEKRNFIVDLGKMKVRDLGTSFNISAYPEDEFFRTTLLEGEITVLDAKNQEIKALDVNQTFRFCPSDYSVEIEELDPLLVKGWTENKFVFIDKPLGGICDEIEKWYGVSIQIEQETLKDEKYTSVIRRTTTVKQLLEMFKLTTGIDYKIEEQKDDEKSMIYLSK